MRGVIPRKYKIKKMKLHNLKPAEGSVHKAIRIGRGEASGKGGTSTKGNKGGQSRAGYKSKMAHEGGQMPIQRRVPKRGFKYMNSLISRTDLVKVLANGELKTKINFRVNAASKKAQDAIVAAGGTIEII
jgi:large subunit ribosomal protein L15